MVDINENRTSSTSSSDVGFSESESDKREIFMRETKQFSCLRRIPELNKLVDSVVASWYLEPMAVSSRTWHRIPYDRPIGLTMIDLNSKKLEPELQIVQSRNLSIEGISFSHKEQIFSREVAVTFDLESPVMEFLVIRLAWSRFSEDQYFQSGGKFLFQVEAAASEFMV